MLIQVTTEDIESATTMPYDSPIALAVQRMGKQALVNHVVAYIDGDRYELPAIAKQNEIAFDFFVKSKEIQGKHLEAIQPYEFELCH